MGSQLLKLTQMKDCPRGVSLILTSSWVMLTLNLGDKKTHQQSPSTIHLTTKAKPNTLPLLNQSISPSIILCSAVKRLGKSTTDFRPASFFCTCSFLSFEREGKELKSNGYIPIRKEEQWENDLYTWSEEWVLNFNSLIRVAFTRHSTFFTRFPHLHLFPFLFHFSSTA